MYRVVIIEDDPMVASINRQYVELNKYLKVVGQFSNGLEALEYLEKQAADLLILDMYMPIMDGSEFLQKLRSRGMNMDVIMVTAANDSTQIKQLLTYGVLDYLVKPFEYIRFNQALAKFINHQNMLSENEQFTQKKLDELFGSESGSPLPEDDLLQKGLQKKTLDRILNFMKARKGEPLTSDTIAREVQLSRVTIRRYMNYLLDRQEIMSDIDYNTGGRPSIIYRYTRS